MAFTSHRVGPGKLTIGADTLLQDFAVQCKSAELTPSAGDSDEINVLSGESIIDQEPETWELSGSVYQEYSMTSLIKWCADNSGKEMPFEYRANNDAELAAKGTLVVSAIKYGGEVKSRAESDFTFKVKGQPQFIAASPDA